MTILRGVYSVHLTIRPFEVDNVFVVSELPNHKLGKVILESDFLVALDNTIMIPCIIFQEYFRPLEWILKQI